MSGTILPLPNTPSWSGAQLKHRDNLIIIIIIIIITIIIKHFVSIVERAKTVTEL
jgi:hypothetical protein